MAQKLYTEEQVREVVRLSLEDAETSVIWSKKWYPQKLADKILQSLQPIELPSDEEIVKELFYQKQVMNPYPTIEYAYTAYEKGFMDCANLIIDKILNK